MSPRPIRQLILTGVRDWCRAPVGAGRGPASSVRPTLTGMTSLRGPCRYAPAVGVGPLWAAAEQGPALADIGLEGPPGIVPYGQSERRRCQFWHRVVELRRVQVTVAQYGAGYLPGQRVPHFAARWA